MHAFLIIAAVIVGVLLIGAAGFGWLMSRYWGKPGDMP